MKISEWNAGKLNSTEIRELIRQHALDKTGDNITGDITCPLPSGTESITNRRYVDKAVMDRAKWVGKYIPLEGAGHVLWEKIKVDKSYSLSRGNMFFSHTFTLDDGAKDGFYITVKHSGDKFSVSSTCDGSPIPFMYISSSEELYVESTYPTWGTDYRRREIPDTTKEFVLNFYGYDDNTNCYIDEICIYCSKTLFDLMEDRRM